MTDGIHVDEASLASPVTRFQVGSSGLYLMADAARDASSYGESSQSDLGPALTAFGAGIEAVLDLFADESGYVADAIEKAKVAYTVTDQHAMQIDTEYVVVEPGAHGEHGYEIA